MSLSELIVVLLVGFFVVKPEDFPKIIAKFKEIRLFITNTKKEIIAHIDPILELGQDAKDDNSLNLDNEIQQMNFYLGKIANIDAEYEGEYSLSSVKEHYRKLVKTKMLEEVND